MEHQKVAAEAKITSLKAKPSYPNINQLTTLLNIQWELPTEFLSLPHLVCHSSGKCIRSHNHGCSFNRQSNCFTCWGEKDSVTNLKNELVDLLGIDIVTQYYNKKLLYEKYYEKMKKRKQSSKIINCDVLAKKGPISLKVYREDGTAEVIEKFKSSDLQLAEWREVVQDCPDRKEKGWKTIYELIKTRIEYLEQTKKELHVDFNKSLQEQDPLDELNDLANKKRKRIVIQQTIPVPSASALQKVYKAGKRLLYAKRNKAISLGKGASIVNREVYSLILKGLYLFTLDYDSQMTNKYFAEYTGIEVKQFRDTLLQLMGNVKKSVAERTRHQRQYDRRLNKRQIQTQESKIDTGKAVDADLVVTKRSGTESEEVNSHAKIQSYKTRNNNKLVDQKSHTQKPGSQIFIGHRFSPNKTFTVYEKTSPRSDLRWKPTGRIFKFVGLRWIPRGKLFAYCTRKDDNEPIHGSNVDIPNIHECKQTLDLSADTSLTVKMEILLEPTSNKLLVGLDDGAFKVNHSTSGELILNFLIIKDLQSQIKNRLLGKIGGGNHKKKDGSKTGNDSSSQPAKLDINVISSGGLGNDITKDNVDGDLVKGTNVVSFDELFPLLNTSRNSIGGILEVVKDAMYSSFMDPKVVEQVEEPMSIIPKSFVSLVTNEAVTCKRVAFPVVENFVKNVWKKFGLVRVMMNSKGFFFSSLLQLRDIPIVSFTVDGLSMMDTKLGNPPMLIRVDQELNKDRVIDIPNMEDDGEVIHTVRVEYEWEPPRCSVCMVFGHDDMLCLKRHVEKPKKQHTNHDGFQHTSYSHGTNVGSKV
ncbi:hypothetical protein Tco_1368726 [Tanacetum coccineum]